MADIFTLPDARSMLKKKRVLFFGDSNIRALYKDLVCLLKSNAFLQTCDLKSKLEPSFMGDKLLKSSVLTRGRNFQECRQFKNENVCVEFYFITCAYCKTVEDIVKSIKASKGSQVDVVVMNSCLWDLSRWGPNGVCLYKENLLKLMKFLNQNLPKETLFIWTTALPISQNCYGGFLIKQVEFLKHTLRFEVMEANMYARDVVACHGYDVLDLHYYFTMQMCRRAKDGIHWLPEAVRFMTNLILTHAALSWHYPLPGNIYNSLLEETVNLDSEALSDTCLPPDKMASGNTSQATSALKSGNPNQTRTRQRSPRKRKAQNRPNMKQQQYQRQPADMWINASHVPHPFGGDMGSATALTLNEQELQDYVPCWMQHHAFDQDHNVDQMRQPSADYMSSELERFEWGNY